MTECNADETRMGDGTTRGRLRDEKQKIKDIPSQASDEAEPLAATLFGLSGADIGYVEAAAEMGLGTMDLDSIKIEQVSV